MGAPAGSSGEYLLARRRIETYVAKLAVEHSVSIKLEVDPGIPSKAATSAHAIALTVGNRTRLLSVDHETFVEDDEFVSVFFLPQIKAAIEELASA